MLICGQRQNEGQRTQFFPNWSDVIKMKDALFKVTPQCEYTPMNNSSTDLGNYLNVENL